MKKGLKNKLYLYIFGFLFIVVFEGFCIFSLFLFKFSVVDLLSCWLVVFFSNLVVRINIVFFGI